MGDVAPDRRGESAQLLQRSRRLPHRHPGESGPKLCATCGGYILCVCFHQAFSGAFQLHADSVRVLRGGVHREGGAGGATRRVAAPLAPLLELD